jgi:hypothetical protein
VGPEGLLTMEGRVQIGSAKILGGPWRAIQIAEDKAHGWSGPELHAMYPLADTETRQRSVSQKERGALRTKSKGYASTAYLEGGRARGHHGPVPILSSHPILDQNTRRYRASPAIK